MEEIIMNLIMHSGEARSYSMEAIQAEAGGDKAEFSLLLCHAQDHFMTTMTLKDVAIEIIDIYTRL